ncbi:MAG: hypothetical protein PH343_10680, partial [Nitrospira sp.]|nr:hypothetical protein [Nitrospira sp.]
VRVFIELLLDHVLSDLNVQHYDLNIPLSKKVQFGITQIEMRKLMNREEIKPIKTMISNKHSILSIDTLHACVHSPMFSPSPQDVRVMWDNAQLFLEKLCDLLKTSKEKGL